MKKTLILLTLLLWNSHRLLAQDCSTIPPTDNKVYKWCYKANEGTNWDTSPYKAYIINGMPFRLLFPKGFDSTSTSTKRYPLAVLLHGIGESGTDNNLQLKYGGKNHLDALNAGKYDGFVFVPQSSSSLWGTAQRNNILKFIEAAIRDIRVDQFRVQVQGYSGGGTASWKLAYDNPLVFAATIPMSSATGSTATEYAQVLKYTAVWHAQGGRDTQPPATAGNTVAKAFQAAGANYTYQYYHELGHGTWNAMYKEPDFFPFLMRNSALRIHALYFKYNFCEGEAVSGIMGVKQGFESYEWRKNGQLISGANANELNFSGEGAYTVRIKHKGVWSQWSEPMHIKRIAPTPTPTIVATGPTALPSLDGRRSVVLRAPKGYQDYKWSNGKTLDSLIVTAAGSYSASVTEKHGCPSAFSAPIKVTFNSVGVLPAPSNLTVATISETALMLSWSDNSSNEEGFEVYRRASSDLPWMLAAQLPANTSNYLDKELQPFTRYHYSIRSVNSSGGSTYISASGKTKADSAPPAAPSNLEAGLTSRNSIDLKWLPAKDNADGENSLTYEIYTNNRSTLVATTTKTAFTVKDLAARQVHNFSVRAVDNSGNKSEFSNQVTAGTYINGLYYTYYEGSISNVYDISLLNPVKSGSTPNFDINTFRNKNDYYAFSFEGYIQIPTAGTYTFYTASDDGSTLSINGIEVVNNNGKHTKQERSGTITLTAGIHEIKVLYFESAGSTDVLEVRWQGPGISKQLIPSTAFKESFSLPTPPAAPANVTATAVDFKSIDLSWTDRSSNESGFEILRSTSNNGTFTVVKRVAANSSQYRDTDLQASTTYYYKIRAVGNSGESAYAGLGSGNIWVNATTSAGASTVSAPTALTAFRTATTVAQLKWKDNAYNETGFEVWRSTDGVNFSKIATTGVDVNTYSDNNISSSNSFHYRVKAVKGGSSSGWSNTTALSTQNRAPVISSLPAVVVAPESTTTEITFDLYDPEGATLQLSSKFLPSFARIEKSTTNKGKIILTPTVKDIGLYKGIQFTASDGTLETDISFSISIKDNQKTSIYVNVGHSSVAPKPWNNTNTYSGVTNKLVIKNMLDENGKATGYSLTLIDPWSSNKHYGETSGNDSGIFPDIVSRSAYIIAPGKTVRFKVSGLSANQRYNFVFFGSSIFKSYNGSTNYTIGNATVNLPVQSNIDKTVQINGVKADVNGEIIVTVAGAADAKKGGYLNAFVIEQYPDNSPMIRPGRLAAHAVSRTQIDLSWTDNSHQEAGFEIWRRTLPSGSFTKIATTAANATSYSNNGLMPDTGYEYKIRAVNGSNYSSFTESKATATLQYQVLINAEFSSVAAEPWNNLSKRPTTGFTWYNFKNEESQRMGINLRLDESFDGNNNFGPNANGQGIYPDKVIKSFYFNEIGIVAKMRIYGLNDNLTYNFRFFASSVFSGGENGVSEYRIGAKKVTLDVQNNLRNTAVIRDVQPTNGSVLIEVEAGEFARYGYLNALVIEARDPYKENSGAGANAFMVQEVSDEAQIAAVEEEPVLYPNPVYADMFVDYQAKTAGKCQLQIIDLSGRLVHSQEFEAREGKNTFALVLNSSLIDKGIYVLRIRSEAAESRTIRFIKQ